MSNDPGRVREREPGSVVRTPLSSASMSTPDQLGTRLGGLEGRLRLLLLHLAGPALRARVEIEDLLQEVYLRALAAQDRIPGPSDGEQELLRYLRVLARHTVIDVARAARAQKRDRREQRLDRSAWSRTRLGQLDPSDHGPGPRTHLEVAETSERLARAFDALTPEHRRVLGLRKFEGLSASEAANRMGRSEKAVHSLYRRALEAWDRELG